MYPEKQCPHGNCLNHSPEFKEVGPLELRRKKHPIWGWRFLFKYCCGKRMKRAELVLPVKCNKCGRLDYQVQEYSVEYCECCGRKNANHEDGGDELT
ncbi:MAG TPA: hypothetical protein GX706_04180 [Candidatus Moranbacteria bacterium]|nr:hypothetical protein [Candidatus Moranbacteria bacterium]